MKIWQWLWGLAVLGTTVWGFRAPGAAQFPEEDLARILFWHLPFAFISVVFLIAGAVQSVRVLRQPGDPVRDAKAEAAAEGAMLASLITMATGILFSKAQWQAWWNWDPRQTSFLFVLLILSAYFAIRGALADPARRAANSAAYFVAALLPILFLIFVLPRLPQVQSLHPSNTIAGGGLKGDYWQVVLANFVLFLATFVWLYRIRVRSTLLEREIDDQDGKLDDGGGRAATGVVRPISVSDEAR